MKKTTLRVGSCDIEIWKRTMRVSCIFRGEEFQRDFVFQREKREKIVSLLEIVSTEFPWQEKDILVFFSSGGFYFFVDQKDIVDVFFIPFHQEEDIVVYTTSLSSFSMLLCWKTIQDKTWQTKEQNRFVFSPGVFVAA